MCYVRVRKKSAKRKIIFALISIFLIAALSIIAINRKLDPIVCDIAEEQIKNKMSSLVSNVVKSRALGGEYINVTYNDGVVASVTTDASALNLLTADVIYDISEKLSQIESYDINVSFSNLFDDEIIFGNSSLTVKASVLPVQSVSAETVTRLDSAGINQTHYSVYILINIDINAVLLISTLRIKTTYEICVADTVIVGKVPEVYLGGG